MDVIGSRARDNEQCWPAKTFLSFALRKLGNKHKHSPVICSHSSTPALLHAQAQKSTDLESHRDRSFVFRHAVGAKELFQGPRSVSTFSRVPASLPRIQKKESFSRLCGQQVVQPDLLPTRGLPLLVISTASYGRCCSHRCAIIVASLLLYARYALMTSTLYSLSRML